MGRTTGRPQRHYSLDDYFVVEESSSTKHEYCRGEIFAMAGASLAHNRITANVLGALHGPLIDKGCSVMASDLRVASPGGLYTYPDVTVVCGRVELVPDRPDTATNPIVLVEVLSDATRDYDRGEKLGFYKGIPTLRECLLIEQDRVLVEHWHRRARTWRAKTLLRLDAVARLAAVEVTLPLREIYRAVLPAGE